MHDNGLPKRKHLRRLGQITIDGPIVFYLTICVEDRKPVLTSPAAFKVLSEVWGRAKAQYGWLIGRYVIMPEHVHFFASPLDGEAKSLSEFIRCWKRSTTRGLHQVGYSDFRWQREFFDHLLRSAESYEAKWNYVRENPVRQKLVQNPEKWPYQGEISPLEV